MALRNYLYAKHIHDTSIDTKINKDSNLMSQHQQEPQESVPPDHPIMHVKQSRKRIVRIVNKSKKTTTIKNNDKSIDSISKNIENLTINPDKKENCLKDCNTCDCKTDQLEEIHQINGNGSESSIDSNDKDIPMIEIEVDNRNELDFTNSI